MNDYNETLLYIYLLGVIIGLFIMYKLEGTKDPEVFFTSVIIWPLWVSIGAVMSCAILPIWLLFSIGAFLGKVFKKRKAKSDYK